MKRYFLRLIVVLAVVCALPRYANAAEDLFCGPDKGIVKGTFGSCIMEKLGQFVISCNYLCSYTPKSKVCPDKKTISCPEGEIEQSYQTFSFQSREECEKFAQEEDIIGKPCDGVCAAYRMHCKKSSVIGGVVTNENF